MASMIRSNKKHNFPLIKFNINHEELLNRIIQEKKRKKEMEDLERSNLVRTNLLLLAGKELSEMKKNNCMVRINSRSIKEAEKDFSEPNMLFVILGEEIFSSSSLKGGKGHGFNSPSTARTGLCSKFNFRQDLSLCNLLNKDLNTDFDITPMVVDDSYSLTRENIVTQKICKRTSIGVRKIQHFKQSVLIKMKKEIYQENNIYLQNEKRNSMTLEIIEKNLELINYDDGLKNEKTLKRSEEGYNYLNKIVEKLKINRSKKIKSVCKSETEKHRSRSDDENELHGEQTQLPSPNLIIILKETSQGNGGNEDQLNNLEILQNSQNCNFSTSQEYMNINTINTINDLFKIDDSSFIRSGRKKISLTPIEKEKLNKNYKSVKKKFEINLFHCDYTHTKFNGNGSN